MVKNSYTSIINDQKPSFLLERVSPGPGILKIPVNLVMRMPTGQCVMRASPSENHLQMSKMRAFKFNYTILKMVWSQMPRGARDRGGRSYP